MPWYVPAILVPTYLISVVLAFMSLNEVEKGADVLNVFLLGGFARDEDFTARGRRYRMWSLGVCGAGFLLVILIYLLSRLDWS